MDCNRASNSALHISTTTHSQSPFVVYANMRLLQRWCYTVEGKFLKHDREADDEWDSKDIYIYTQVTYMCWFVASDQFRKLLKTDKTSLSRSLFTIH